MDGRADGSPKKAFPYEERVRGVLQDNSNTYDLRHISPIISDWDTNERAVNDSKCEQRARQEKQTMVKLESDHVSAN